MNKDVHIDAPAPQLPPPAAMLRHHAETRPGSNSSPDHGRCQHLMSFTPQELWLSQDRPTAHYTATDATRLLVPTTHLETQSASCQAYCQLAVLHPRHCMSACAMAALPGADTTMYSSPRHTLPQPGSPSDLNIIAGHARTTPEQPGMSISPPSSGHHQWLTSCLH